MAINGKALCPLTFAPVLRDYVWGGRNLNRLYGRALPPDGPLAESWEISAHPNGSCVVDAGPWQGQSLPEVLASLGVDLLGERAPWASASAKFPLLIKLLDAAQPLSVQVHPSDDYALVHENGELGKTEMWYVLHAQPNAQIILGLRQNVSPDDVRRAIANHTLHTYVHFLPVQAGDAVFIPVGTVHALLAGLLVVEVEQNSDTTYRLYDWGRLGADGQPRPLHVDKGLQVIDFKQTLPGLCRPILVGSEPGVVRHEITRCEYFVVEKVRIEPGATYAGHTAGQTLEIWGAVDGQAELNWAGPAVPLPAIRFCLIPACLGHFTIRARTAATMPRVYLP